MNMKIKKLAAMVLSVFMILSLAACSRQERNDPAQSPSNAEGPFANMETVDLEGEKIDSSAFADYKLTLVNAWNLGCTLCIEKLPALEKLSKEYADKGVAVKGLYYSFGEELTKKERTEIAQVLANARAEYPQLLASEAMMESSELKDMAAFPTTFFIDSESRIVDIAQGSQEHEDWAFLLDKMLEKGAAND